MTVPDPQAAVKARCPPRRRARRSVVLMRLVKGAVNASSASQETRAGGCAVRKSAAPRVPTRVDPAPQTTRP